MTDREATAQVEEAPAGLKTWETPTVTIEPMDDAAAAIVATPDGLGGIS